MKATAIMDETKAAARDELNCRLAQADQEHAAQIAHLRDLIARKQSITESMRVLVEIEKRLTALNDEWVSLLSSQETP